MTDHRPECFALMCECDETHFESTDCHLVCICPSLRACEQRVLGTIRRDSWFEDGWNQALDAAREAVAAMNDMQPSWWKAMFFGGRRARWWCQYGWDWGKRDALTVIDRLREKP